MISFNRDRFRKKISKLLSFADEEQFVQLVWAVDALQSDRVEAARKFITFPPEAATADIGSAFAIYKWELETLVSLVLRNSKREPHEGPNRHLNCTTFNSIRAAANLLRSLENAESQMYLKQLHILREMHRIGQREFAWQRGFVDKVQFYRYAYIYGQGLCADYFEKQNGITINDFSFVGFLLYATLNSGAWVRKDFDATSLGVTKEITDRAIALLSVSLDGARSEVKRLFSNSLPTAYQPSVLRRYPVISFGQNGERLRAPLTDLIALRISAGLFYDIVGGGAQYLNDANSRFERYCESWLAKMLPGYVVGGNIEYGTKAHAQKTPDILVRNNGAICVAIECKAAKLTVAAQFANDPLSEAKRGYDQMAEGVVQLWKFFSHARRGVFTEEKVANDASAMILTLDTWLMASAELQLDVINTAKNLIKNQPDILPEDQKPVIFCPVASLEAILNEATEDSFIGTLKKAEEAQYQGWMLETIHRKEYPDGGQRKPFPFDLADVLPWWKRTETFKARIDAASQSAP